MKQDFRRYCCFYYSLFSKIYKAKGIDSCIQLHSLADLYVDLPEPDFKGRFCFMGYWSMGQFKFYNGL